MCLHCTSARASTRVALVKARQQRKRQPQQQSYTYSHAIRSSYTPTIGVFSQFLARHVTVRVGELEEVNAVDPQPLQHAVYCCFQIFPEEQQHQIYISAMHCYWQELKRCSGAVERVKYTKGEANEQQHASRR